LSNKWILSATEIDTFLTCKKKWALKYLAKEKEPESPAKTLGLAVHNALFNYLSNQPYNQSLGQVIAPGLIFLPKNLSKENLEVYFAYTKGQHIFHGYIDFYENIGSQKWLVGDHKTASNLKTAFTPNELKQDIQANIYAQWVFSQKEAKAVQLKWVYYRTKSTPKALCVETELLKEECEENFKKIIAIADEISLLVKTTPKIFPKNTSACFKYGRCHFYNQCHSTFFSDIEVIMPPKKLNDAFHLYVDCLPSKAEGAYEKTIELSDFLKPVLDKINQEKNLNHYRLAGYGQHVGFMASYLGDYLQSNSFDSRTAILSSSKTPEGIDTLQTLSGAAGRVIRGL